MIDFVKQFVPKFTFATSVDDAESNKYMMREITNIDCFGR
jgi:hypothetical protein